MSENYQKPSQDSSSTNENLIRETMDTANPPPTALPILTQSITDDSLWTNVTLPGDFTPIQRILLTANGTLQRLLSAYFNRPIFLRIVKHEEQKSPHQSNFQSDFSISPPVVFLRQSELVMDNEIVICHASSRMEITSPDLLERLSTSSIGIGQLFRTYHLHPEFCLYEVGSSHDTFHRRYSLSASGIYCMIHESFVSRWFATNSALS
jgi:hypothetical protein